MTKTKCLGSRIPLLPDQADALSLLQLLLGNNELAKISGKDLACMLQVPLGCAEVLIELPQ